MMNEVDRLKKSGKWMVRFSRAGIGHGNYVHAPIGEWAECPRWTDEKTCDGGGFFGQTMGACGFSHDAPDIEIAEYKGEPKKIGGDKAAVRSMRIIARGQYAMDILAELCDGKWPGSINVSEGINCALTSIGGDAYIHEGVSVPALTSIGGGADIRDGVSLPALTSIGGYAYIHEGVSVPNLQTVKGKKYHA